MPIELVDLLDLDGCMLQASSASDASRLVSEVRAGAPSWDRNRLGSFLAKDGKVCCRPACDVRPPAHGEAVLRGRRCLVTMGQRRSVRDLG